MPSDLDSYHPMASTMSQPSLLHNNSVERTQGSSTAKVVRRFLAGMEYYAPAISSTNVELEALMRTEMNSRGICCPQLEGTLHTAASLIELGYSGHRLEEKKIMALYNWYLIYIDDISLRNPHPFRVFQERFLRHLPQSDPVLEALVDVLMGFYEYFDAPIANSILNASFNYLNSTCMELEIETLSLTRTTTRFPWFLRDQTGVGIAFSLMLFPKSIEAQVSDYIRALPEMDFWISASNDVLSFYKEELAGDRVNYVHNRAYIGGKAPLDVLAEMSEELTACRKTIHAALAHCTRAMDVWRIWEHGSVKRHLEQQRYRLRDLSL